MSSGIEEIIEEIEEYVDGCKPSAFSPSKIIVNRDELESLLEELRTKTPEEIKRYHFGRCTEQGRCHHRTGTDSDQRTGQRASDHATGICQSQ